MPSEPEAGPNMRCLWLTLADPEPPLNGQYVYSSGLINSVAAAGIDVEVLGLRRPDSAHRYGMRNDHIVWWLPDRSMNVRRARWGRLASGLPHTAYRCGTADMRRELGALLARGNWDGIVFDGISVGWALSVVRKHYAGHANPPRMIYVSHNHEETLHARLAENQTSFLKRHVERLDALKVSRLERALLRSVDFVSTITLEDQLLYRSLGCDKPMEVVTPGYRGRRVSERRISDETPRRAVIVGSYDWIAKRMNLAEFFAIADPMFADRSAELQVVGSADESFLAPLRRSAKATSFTGTVSSVNPYLDNARIAIVPERHGGGFKLKILECVFNRLPVFALADSVAGVPLVHGESIMLYADHGALALGVLEAIDDFALLNRLQERAYAACHKHFDWESRGRQLLQAIAA